MADRAQVVMITGAAGHLGRSVAQAFADAGATRVLVDRDANALEAAFGADADGGVLLAPTDLLDPAQVEATAETAVERYGRIDVLCHLAGGFRMGEAVHETSAATWGFVFDINVRTLLHVAHAVVPRMIEGGGGSIVTVGALSARQGLPRVGAYGAAKSAVLRLSEAMAAELREHRIRVNCVLPSTIDTPLNRAEMPQADRSGWVTAADIAQTMVWLASERSRALRGAALPMNGGA
jgi:NAD(P)-dependent dehydrogenase (short-subunit alcohol dehydrogenase family)